MNCESTIWNTGKHFDITTPKEETGGGDGFIYSTSKENYKVKKK